MTYAEMVATVPDKNSPVNQAARGFFSVHTDKGERAKFLTFLLRDARYEQLCKLMYCGNLNGNTNVQTFDGRTLSPDAALHARYFDLYRRFAAECDIAPETEVPLYAAAVKAKKNEVLRAWRPFAERALTEWASADYEAAWRYISASDPDFLLADILVRVDRERALDDLTDLAVSGKGVNKVALRRYLRKYPAEVFARVRPKYAALKTDARVSAVRLLLLYKNDERVLEFLRELERTEKAQSAVKLLHAHVSARSPLKGTDRKQIVQYFYDAMVYGTSVTGERFVQELIKPPFTEVAESLFYGVYEQDKLQNIVIVDRGRILDIENRDIELPPSCCIKVLHPVELTPKTEFLARLNITQPFTQIKRKVYRASQDDVHRGGCFGIAGTVVPVPAFVSRMRKCGFRALSRDGDNFCRQVGLARDGVLCVLNLSPVDLTADDGTVRAQCVRFYAEADVVRLGVQRYVEGVPSLSPAEIDARAFSEFMYSVYALMGCR